MAVEEQEARAERSAYTSPPHKLVAFFLQSRDQWKAKCRGAKAGLTQLKKQVHRGAARRRRDHERIRALVAEVGRLQAENRRLSAVVAAGEKKER
jgi:hypothetical protein